MAILCSLVLGVAACEQGQYCGDVEANATVTDVLHDPLADRVIVGLYHSLSFCTGTDEKRFINKRIEVDLTTGEVFVDERASNSRGPLRMPENGIPLFTDSSFSSHNCRDCELVLRSYEGGYTFHFTSIPELDPVMTLAVLAGDAPLAVVEID